MTRMTRLATVLATLTLTLGAAAHAAQPLDLTTEKGRKKAVKALGIEAGSTLNKNTGVPQRVGIVGFQMRYEFASQEYGWDSETVVHLSDEQYQEVTDQLYDHFVGTLEGWGFEVVPRAELLATQAYQDSTGGLEEGANTKGNDRVVYAPSGMKNLGKLLMATTKVGGMAGVQEELGTDALLFAFVNFQLCEVGGKKKDRGTKICLRGRDDRHDIAGAYVPQYQVSFHAGHREDKRGTDYFVGGGSLSKAGEPLVADTSAILVDRDPKVLKTDWSADTEAFANGAAMVLDIATDLALGEWDASTAKLRKKLHDDST